MVVLPFKYKALDTSKTKAKFTLTQYYHQLLT